MCVPIATINQRNSYIDDVSLVERRQNSNNVPMNWMHIATVERASTQILQFLHNYSENSAFKCTAVAAANVSNYYAPKHLPIRKSHTQNVRVFYFSFSIAVGRLNFQCEHFSFCWNHRGPKNSVRILYIDQMHL